MLSALILYTILFDFGVTSAMNYTRIENTAHIYVGSTHIQKIREIMIDGDSLACTDKYLPITFAMLNEERKSVEAKAFLSEYGSLVQRQENLTTCHIYKKYNINDDFALLVFENRAQLHAKSNIYKVVSDELYEKYFITWIFFKLECYSEKHGNISWYCSAKEITFYSTWSAFILFLITIIVKSLIEHYGYYLRFREWVDERRRQEMERQILEVERQARMEVKSEIAKRNKKVK